MKAKTEGQFLEEENGGKATAIIVKQ